ncbi:MAG: heparin lyase I family protein [Burkholderiaceae bacterium]|nr:heparin lyase I family protein [Burkholderiaceae bacterium]
MVYWVDPRQPFAEMRRWNAATQVAGPNRALADVAEPGIVGAGADYALSRVTDPLVPTRAAFRHRLSAAFPMWGDTYRSEISANWGNDGTTVVQGLDYWIAWSVKLEPDLVQVGGGEVSLLDFHVVPDAGDTQNNSPFHLFLNDSAWRLVSLNNPDARTLKERTVLTTLWRESSPATDRWHRFVMKVRFHWDGARSPYIRVWKASGEGPLALIVNRDGPNAFNDQAVYLPQKFGLYRWDPWVGAPTRTLYTKGFYVLRDLAGPSTLDEQAMLALLDRI